MAKTDLIPAERIERAILLIRGQKVMLDRDLAVLYEVSTKRLNEQVRRNLARFFEDFMFQLTKESLRLGGRKLRPPIPRPRWACGESPRPSPSRGHALQCLEQ